jgi:hypothetical protein
MEFMLSIRLKTLAEQVMARDHLAEGATLDMQEMK